MSFSGLVLIAIQTSSVRYVRVATASSAAAGSDVGDGAFVLTLDTALPRERSHRGLSFGQLSTTDSPNRYPFLQ